VSPAGGLILASLCGTVEVNRRVEKMVRRRVARILF
jgi:hypothetical protein